MPDRAVADNAAEGPDLEELLEGEIRMRREQGSGLVVVMAGLAWAPSHAARPDARPLEADHPGVLLTLLAQLDDLADHVVRLGEQVVCVVTGVDDAAAQHKAATLARRLAERVVDPDNGVPDGMVLRTGNASAPEHGDRPGQLVHAAAVARFAKTDGTEEPVTTRPLAHAPGPPPRHTVITLPDRLDDLDVAFQPKVAFSDGHLTGAEALIRWPAAWPVHVPAQTIVAMARDAGRLCELTDVVLNRAAAHCASMQQAGFTVPVSVNLTGDDIADPRLPNRLQVVLDSHELDAECLVMEVTENALLTREIEALGVIPALADMGARLSIDDFGTGYSSLSHLRRFPINEIKIDMSFVDRMAFQPMDAVIVRSIVDMGHGLGMEVVAEGVETSETWSLLEEFGTDVAQGHHVMKALDPATFLVWADFWAEKRQPRGGAAVG